MSRSRIAHTLLFLLLLAVPTWAATGGRVSGTVADPTGATVSQATLQLTDEARQTVYRTLTDSRGRYTFPNLPVGHYTLTIAATGFAAQRSSGLAVDEDSATRLDLVLSLATQAEAVTVTANTAVQAETTATQLGEVVSAAQITALPLNGRSYTDLLATQPGVAPVSTLLPSSVIMAGVTGSIDPSGDANPGNLSVNGQRESSNGFMVNGIDVQEHMNGGTSILPNLDSIDQFRVLTNNFDPEYGNYNGSMVTVITRSGSNHLHGSAFEFLRNTALDARGYFDPTRSAFRQNQFGGTLGGQILRDKLFFFADYQGTRTTQGISTGNISVPTLAQRQGSFNATDLPNSVSGPYLAQLLSSELGYAVTSGEAYASVFPTGIIPQSAWSAPARNLLAYIPKPNVSDSQFSTSANAQTVRDDKGSLRFDANNGMGQLSAYYFVDDYTLDNPYPTSVAGATIPGFDALYSGRAQLLSLGHTKVVGPDIVNELHLGLLRNANVVGQPHGGLGVSLASQGFSTGTDGIYVQAPQFEGIENITFPTFTMGVPITNETQVNNTLFVSEGLSIAVRAHTFKLGGQFHLDQVNEHPNATFNGTFNINGTETGSPYADFLLGTPSNFTQSSGQPFYLRNHYLGLYAQDSWRVSSALTLNAGLRWDLLQPWHERYNQLQTWVSGAQSTLYPGAPPGLLVAGDPSIPATLAPTSDRSFAPRLGAAYAPAFDSGLGKLLFGARGQSSLRAGFGMFYTAFPGLAAGIMYAVPPFGYNYLSPGPPLLDRPFLTAATGVDNGQRFPFAFPAHNVSASNPDNAVDWANFTPISADPFFDHRNRPAYLESYMLSLQRQLGAATLLTVSYAGNQGHRELALVSVNPGNAALCLATSGCGPFGEDSTYTGSTGQTIQGTRVGQGPDYGENTADRSIASSNYNALETTLRYQHHGSSVLFSYTYAKSIDQGSNLGEQLNPFTPRQSRTLSAWDLKHDLVASYTLALPFDRLIDRLTDRLTTRYALLTQDWSLSGVTRFATGLPVTLFDNSDNSLLGTLGNGANNYLLDTPRQLPGNLQINRNGRNSKPAFNTALFPTENLGQLGNAKRRAFYGPGMENFDLTLRKQLRLTEHNLLELRVEAFNAFNHAQFFGPAAVNGQDGDPNYGQIVSATTPRLIQLAARISF